jgi:uncharacterized OsmC-like protein
MEMTITTKPTDNGINLEALLGARAAVTDDPELGEFQWRVTSEWVSGTHSRSTMQGFGGLRGEQAHVTEFGYDVDHPECFASEDHGPTPTEFVLVGLAGCLTAGIAAVAQMRDIQLRSVKATLTGDMNVIGVLGGDPEVRNGFDRIGVHFDIDADATPADIEALVAQSQKRSAVYDAVTNPTAVTVTVN